MVIARRAFHFLPVAVAAVAISLPWPNPCSAQEAPAATPNVLHVGPGQTYAVPSLAAAASRDGDVVEIQAGEYEGNVAVWRANDLTIRGVGGYAHLKAQGKSAQKKAIWVIDGKNTIVEYIEFSGCKVPERNGAGIRQQGAGLTLRHCRFHDNQDGVLTGANPESDIVFENCEFGHNGFGDGLSHNIYIGHVRRFTMIGCYSHHAKIGHLVKSRAAANYILFNRLSDESDGNSSYVLQIPNGGKTYVIGNILQQGPRAENVTMVSYADEGAKNPVQELYLINNTFVNERRKGKFLRVVGENAKVVAVDNLFTGAPGPLELPGDSRGNLLTDAPGFVDAAHYDYHLTADSPARYAGVDPGKDGDYALAPSKQYVHPVATEPRLAGNKIDAGAYQFTPPVK